MEKKWNPRWVAWLKSRGETPETFTKDEDGLVVDPHDGKKRPAALVYILWMQNAWQLWAIERGFRSHEEALMAGMTHAEFDAWLERRAV